MAMVTFGFWCHHLHAFIRNWSGRHCQVCNAQENRTRVTLGENSKKKTHFQSLPFLGVRVRSFTENATFKRFWLTFWEMPSIIPTDAVDDPRPFSWRCRKKKRGLREENRGFFLLHYILLPSNGEIQAGSLKHLQKQICLVWAYGQN